MMAKDTKQALIQSLLEGKLSRREFITRATALGLSVSTLGSLLQMPAYAQEQGKEVLRVRARGGEDIDTMDPAHYIGNEEYNLDLVVYSKLIKFQPGSTEYELDAASSLDISEDNTVIDFALKEGIQFHGSYGELTAEDVKFSFERIIDPEVNSPYKPDWQTLERVEVTDRYSGRIILSAPYAPLLTSTLPWTPGSIVSKKAVEELGQRFATNPIGSGPYYWAEWRPNQLIVLERFADYYGAKPDFGRLEVLPLAELQVAEIAFDRGELDSTAISLDSIERYRQTPNVKVDVLNTLRYHWLGFNHELEPFNDIRVRKAVRYATDVAQILTGAYSGIPEEANTILAPGILGFWEDAPDYEVDLDKARQLLAEAGYEGGFETQITTDNTTVHTLSSAIIQQQLQKIGINARINIIEDYFSYLGEASHPGLHYASFSAVLDPGYWFSWFTCEQIGQWNYWKWCNEEYGRLHEEAARTLDLEKRAAMYTRMQEIIHEDVCCVWTTHGASVHASYDNIDPVFLAMYSQYRYWQNTAQE